MRKLAAVSTLLFLLMFLPLVASAGVKRPPAGPINPCVPVSTQPVIPEPSSIILFGLGVAIVGGAVWRRTRAQQ